MPPLVVYSGSFFIAFTNPKAALGSRMSRSPATTAPAQPPTPEAIATYCFPSGPLNVVGWPITPLPHLNCHRSLPPFSGRASTHLNQPSIVPKNTTSPAVTTVPLQQGNISFSRQTIFLFTTSQQVK